MNSIGIFVVIAVLSIESKYYSQFKQDNYLNNNFFKDKRDGIFVDIGAHDGIKLNNTYFFEKELNWRL